MLQYVTDKSSEVRQAACYGCGVLGQVSTFFLVFMMCYNNYTIVDNDREHYTVKIKIILCRIYPRFSVEFLVMTESFVRIGRLELYYGSIFPRQNAFRNFYYFYSITC